MKLCDVCGNALKESDAVVVSPQEMRIIAGNGYGQNITLGEANLSPEERKQKFYQLAMTNNTPWALCPACHEKTRSYTKESEEGPSEEQFREMAIEPLLKAMGGNMPAEKKGSPHSSDNPNQAPADGKKMSAASGVVSFILACIIYFVGYTIIEGKTPGAGDVVGIVPIIILILLWGAVSAAMEAIKKPKKKNEFL